MGIRRAVCGDLQLGWQSPVKGPVHPAFVSTRDPRGFGWIAGFDELLVRCGLESNGAPEFTNGVLRYPLHGEVANLPAHTVAVRDRRPFGRDHCQRRGRRSPVFR